VGAGYAPDHDNASLKTMTFFVSLSNRKVSNRIVLCILFQKVMVKKMKGLIFTGLFLGIASLCFSQTIQDKQIVIQMSIDLDDLQQYYRFETEPSRKPLIIANEGIIPETLVLTKFGEPVQFKTTEELFFYNKEAFLQFSKFDITSTRAQVEFQYHIEGLTIALTFEKRGGKWEYTMKELTVK
jgi:hypothetical protein